MSDRPLPQTIRLQLVRGWRQLSPIYRADTLAVKRALANFMRDGITGTTASGMAYYFIFSLFPLTLLLAVFIGNIISPLFAQEEISQALNLFLPHDAVQLIHDNLGFVLGNGQRFGLAAVIGLTWSSLGILSEVTRVLDNVFDVPVPRTFIQQRLTALLMVFMLLVLLAFTFITLGALQLLSVFALNHTILWVALSLKLIPFGLSLLVLTVTLHYVPNCVVSWDAVWPAALVGAMGWEGVRYGLNWYVSHVARYSMIYGSISVVIVLMLWAYCMALVFLLSAELCARLNEVRIAQPLPQLSQNRDTTVSPM
jgi:membrane protein